MLCIIWYYNAILILRNVTIYGIKQSGRRKKEMENIFINMNIIWDQRRNAVSIWQVHGVDGQQLQESHWGELKGFPVFSSLSWTLHVYSTPKSLQSTFANITVYLLSCLSHWIFTIALWGEPLLFSLLCRWENGGSGRKFRAAVHLPSSSSGLRPFKGTQWISIDFNWLSEFMVL